MWSRGKENVIAAVEKIIDRKKIRERSEGWWSEDVESEGWWSEDVESEGWWSEDVESEGWWSEDVESEG